MSLGINVPRPFGAGCNNKRMVTLDEQLPEEGQAVISWNVSIINGEKRLGWKFETTPELALNLAQSLMADVTRELEGLTEDRD
jgi:hypothetical protein